MMRTYAVRLAVAEDVDAMIRLRTEAEQWLRDNDIRQWTADYDQYARDVLRDAVAAGKAWVVEDDGQVIATISLNGPDLVLWHPEDDPATALYLGKMIVSRRYAGQDLGAALMNWASLRAAKAGKTWIRLDVRRDNINLHRYYETRGWTHVRTEVPEHRRTESGALFQRRAGSVTSAQTIVHSEESRT